MRVVEARPESESELLMAPTSATPTSSREQILAKPGPVRSVLQAWMTKWSLDDPALDYEALGSRALAWWDELMFTCAGCIPDATETDVAESMIEVLRGREVWGPILRGNAS